MLDADGATKVTDLEKLENQVGVSCVMNRVEIIVLYLYRLLVLFLIRIKFFLYTVVGMMVNFLHNT